jgi:UDP-2,3-diacylglucosamine hydrolase
MQQLTFPSDATLYFASDFHLGIPSQVESTKRETKIISWLTEAHKDANAIFLVGDLFDFWFEYKKVIPKGFVRLIGKIAEIADSGTPIYIFRGNHDLWLNDYFELEIGIKVFKDPIEIKAGEKTMYVGHGDGLGPGDTKFKAIKKIFDHRLAKWCFRWLHPDIGIALANRWSRQSRKKEMKIGGEKFEGDNERLFRFAQEMEANQHFDYYIFGHRHLPLEMKVTGDSIYFNLGEWITSSHYCVYRSGNMQLVNYEV